MQTILVLTTTTAFLALLVGFVRLRGRRGDVAFAAARRERHRRLERALGAAAGRVDLAGTILDVDGACGLGVDARAGNLLLFRVGEDSGLDVRVLDGREVLGAEVVQHVFGEAVKRGTEVCVAGVDLVVLLADRDLPAVVLSLLGERAVYGSDAHRAARDQAYGFAARVRAVSRRGAAAAERPPETADARESEKERARALAERYLTHRGRAEDELSQRQVRAREPSPTR